MPRLEPQASMTHRLLQQLLWQVLLTVMRKLTQVRNYHASLMSHTGTAGESNQMHSSLKLCCIMLCKAAGMPRTFLQQSFCLQSSIQSVTPMLDQVSLTAQLHILQTQKNAGWLFAFPTLCCVCSMATQTDQNVSNAPAGQLLTVRASLARFPGHRQK